MAVRVDLYLDAAIRKDALGDDGHQIDALDFLADDERCRLVVRVRRACADRRDEAPPGVDQLAVPFRAGRIEGHDRRAAVRGMLQDRQWIATHDPAARVAVTVAGAGSAFRDVAHDRTGIAADLLRDLLFTGIVRVEAFGKLAHRAASFARIAARMRLGVAGNLVISTPVACRIALRIAGAVGISTCSPNPLAPKGPSGSGTSTRMDSIGGTSPRLG